VTTNEFLASHQNTDKSGRNGEKVRRLGHSRIKGKNSTASKGEWTLGKEEKIKSFELYIKGRGRTLGRKGNDQKEAR